MSVFIIALLSAPKFGPSIKLHFNEDVFCQQRSERGGYRILGCGRANCIEHAFTLI
jgi:hypothetical protein